MSKPVDEKVKAMQAEYLRRMLPWDIFYALLIGAFFGLAGFIQFAGGCEQDIYGACTKSGELNIPMGCVGFLGGFLGIGVPAYQGLRRWRGRKAHYG